MLDKYICHLIMPQEKTESDKRRLGLSTQFAGVSFIATITHMVVCFFVEWKSFWIEYHLGHNYTWTNLAWLPGGVVDGISGIALSHDQGMEVLGLLIRFLGSCIAGITLSTVVCGRRGGLRLNWKIWGCALLLWLGWIPVPSIMTTAYWGIG
jgi:hypothetical protein